jgi:hypothetical protein
MLCSTKYKRWVSGGKCYSNHPHAARPQAARGRLECGEKNQRWEPGEFGCEALRDRVADGRDAGARHGGSRLLYRA